MITYDGMEAWLGPALSDLTPDDVNWLTDAANRIEKAKPGGDASGDRDSILSSAVRILTRAREAASKTSDDGRREYILSHSRNIAEQVIRLVETHPDASIFIQETPVVPTVDAHASLSRSRNASELVDAAAFQLTQVLARVEEHAEEGHGGDAWWSCHESLLCVTSAAAALVSIMATLALEES